MRKFHEVEQGSDSWHQLRDEHLTASDAPAMMGDSKYKSRNQLLHEKKTGQKPAVSPQQQALFDKGHAAEATARTITEMEYLEDFPPVVVTTRVEGLNLLASLDGFCANDNVIWEHKLWNETLAQNVRNKVLEPSHYWQLEHQLLVMDAKSVLFVVSDGTANKRESFMYYSNAERRAELIAGWKQFVKDLIAYTPQAKQEAVVGSEVPAFPMVTYEVQGAVVVSNIAEVLPIIKERAELEMNRVLETDQDFANKEKLNKATRQARAKLKDVVTRAQGEFVSFSEFSETAQQIDAVLQQMQAQGERQVKLAKEIKKREIVDAAAEEFGSYMVRCDEKIKPLQLYQITSIMPDWVGAMKGKRNLESIQNAVDDVTAKAKIEIDQAMAKIVPNQIFLKEHAAKYTFLFNDVAQIINQDVEPFQAIVKSRIAGYEQVEAERKADEERKLKEAAERKAKQEEEREARRAEQARIEAERKKVETEDENHIADANKMVEQPTEQVADPGKVIPIEGEKGNENPLGDFHSFALSMSKWADDYKISSPALQELSGILKRYGVIPEPEQQAS